MFTLQFLASYKALCERPSLAVRGPASLSVRGLGRAAENLKMAGNWPKVAAMRGLQNYQKCRKFVFFKIIIPISVVFYGFFFAFTPI